MTDATIDEGILYKADCLPLPADWTPDPAEAANAYCESVDCQATARFAFGIGGGYAYLCATHYEDLPDKLGKEETND
jgi:hypothetical protein